ncbi:uncharacterized protein VDAG_04542 [Verticillium dahliae VdLs.17]|uniref:Uncharacterized protein n=1 Tax=Verticillium dahliae (strain VdLs.17 / ATCC MYA-4575 / FGSC 10137) TaxID=498257 RepID=G2X2L8_VERDV|nr:uncharacterized protein VDAG_04542 [Verticillium dahliae VdLs.17]EGY23104.1 hypothetical protein VDAG_04542 [Verticillium dahliae VdLs.17]
MACTPPPPVVVEPPPPPPPVICEPLPPPPPPVCPPSPEPGIEVIAVDVDPVEKKRRRRRSHSRHSGSHSREVYIEREKIVPVRVPVPVPQPQQPEYETFRYVDAPRRSPPRIMPAPPREEREEDRMRIMIHDRRREREYVDDGYQGSGSDRGCQVSRSSSACLAIRRSGTPSSTLSIRPSPSLLSTSLTILSLVVSSIRDMSIITATLLSGSSRLWEHHRHLHVLPPRLPPRAPRHDNAEDGSEKE